MECQSLITFSWTHPVQAYAPADNRVIVNMIMEHKRKILFQIGSNINDNNTFICTQHLQKKKRLKLEWISAIDNAVNVKVNFHNINGMPFSEIDLCQRLKYVLQVV